MSENLPEVRKLELQNHFFRIANEVCDSYQLKPNEMNLYVYLVRYSYGKNLVETLNGTPISLRRLAEKMNIKKADTLSVAAKGLEEKGLIKTYKVPIDNYRSRTVFELLDIVPKKDDPKNRTTIQETAEKDVLKNGTTDVLKNGTTIAEDVPKKRTTNEKDVPKNGVKYKEISNKEINNNKEKEKKGKTSSANTKTLTKKLPTKTYKPTPLSTERLASLINNKTMQPLTYGEFITYYQQQHKRVFGHELDLTKVTDNHVVNAYNYLLGYGTHKFDRRLEKFSSGQLLRLIPFIFRAFKEMDGYKELTFYMISSGTQRTGLIRVMKKAVDNSGILAEIEAREKQEKIESDKRDPYKQRQRELMQEHLRNSNRRKGKALRTEMLPDWYY